MRAYDLRPTYESTVRERSNERNEELKKIAQLRQILAKRLEQRQHELFAKSPTQAA